MARTCRIVNLLLYYQVCLLFRVVRVVFVRVARLEQRFALAPFFLQLHLRFWRQVLGISVYQVSCFSRKRVKNPLLELPYPSIGDKLLEIRGGHLCTGIIRTARVGISSGATHLTAFCHVCVHTTRIMYLYGHSSYYCLQCTLYHSTQQHNKGNASATRNSFDRGDTGQRHHTLRNHAIIMLFTKACHGNAHTLPRAGVGGCVVLRSGGNTFIDAHTTAVSYRTTQQQQLL